MKKILLSILVLVSATLQAQWNYIVTDAYAYGCPGYVCITGPTTGYTFEISPFSFFGPQIPGSCGGAEFAVPAGVFNVTIKQTSTGNVLQTFSNIVVSQPPACAIELQNQTVYQACYNNNELSFYVGGLWCGGGTIYVTKDNTYYTSYGFNSHYQYLTGLTPGNYIIQAGYLSCLDTMHVTIQDNCAKPDSGITTTNISKTGARVNWLTKPCALKYRVQYRPSTSALWTTVTSNTGTKYLGNLVPGTTYKWRVKSRCNLNPVADSEWSVIKTFTTLPLRESTTELIEAESELIKVFPNPASNYLSIDSEIDFTENVSISLTGLDGKSRCSQFSRSNENQIQVDISSLSNGIYQLTLISNNNIYHRKVVIMK